MTGRGNVFSAGVDLFKVLDGGGAYLDTFLPALHDALLRLFSLPRPVVAAINGHAIAGGCVLACTTDLRVMAEGDARIGMPEVRVGVPFPAAIFEFVRAAVGPRWLSEIVYLGRTYTPEAARQMRLY